LKLCIEFDGYLHYTKSKSVLDDKRKDEIVAGAGYKIVRIPYFIQLSAKTIKTLFGAKVAWKQEFPHGFVSNEPTVVLPADFCEAGLERFKQELKLFSSVKKDIIDSFKLRKEPIDAVLPPSLQYLLTEEVPVENS
jgi:hypothetical protein